MKGGGNKSKAKAKPADNKLSVKKKGAAAKPAKKDNKAVKDPNKPKRPASAFFVFMEDFRKTYKEKHPNNKSVADVGKAGGARWKQLTKEEKAPYVEKAEKRKVDYDKTMKAYNKKQAEGTKDKEEEEDEADSDKSQSEVNDEDDDDDSEEDEDDD